MKRTILIVMLISAGYRLAAQEGQFSQFYASSVFLNPAFAALKPSLTMTTNYKRSQRSPEGAYQELYQFSVLYPLQKTTSLHSQTGGIGFSASNESIGPEGLYQTTKALVSGAYVLAFDRLKTRKLVFGLQGGVIQNRLSYENLQFGSQYNPYIGFDETLLGENVNTSPVYAPVFSSGVLFSITDHYNPFLQQNTMQLGLAVDYLNRPRYGFLVDEKGVSMRRPMRFKLMGTSRFKLSPRLFIHPSCLILINQSSYQANMGTYFSTFADQRLTTMIQAGVWYRYQDALIFLTGFQYRNMQMGFSFDLNSKGINPNEVLSERFQPAYEVSLAYSFDFSSGPVNVVSPLF